VKLDHLTVPVRDYEASKRFYVRALEPFGFSVLMDWHDKRRAYLGVAPRPSSLWLVESPDAGALEVSLAVDDRQSVEAFHRAAVAAGATSVHGPSVRPEHTQDYFAARVTDPDGNVLEAVHRGTAVSRAAAA
jgi:catechol 2,3-dioxygenase-like lactoylglutathione lyase family enzyme